MNLPHPALKKPTTVVFCGALFFQLLLLSRLAASHHLVPTSDDMKFYLDWGLRISSGQWTDHQAFYGLPGYAYLLGFLLSITGKDVVATCLIAGGIQAVAFAGVASVIFLLVVDAIGNLPDRNDRAIQSHPIWVGYIAAAGWILFVPAQAYSLVLMPTVVAIFVYWFGVRLFSRAPAPERAWKWVLLGLLIGVTAMFVATVFFLLPLALFSLFFAVPRGKKVPGRYLQACVATISMLSGVVVGCAPAWLHNVYAARDPVLLSAHSGINVWIGNNPEANGYPKFPEGLSAGQEGLARDSLRIPSEAAGRPLLRSEASQFWASKAHRWIAENRVAWLRLLITKTSNFWNAFQYDDINILRLLRSDGVTLGFSSYGLLAALGLAAIPLITWNLPRSRWVVAGLLLHMAALLPVFITERYRLAAVPGLLICASLGLWLCWRSLLGGRWTVSAAYVPMMAAGAAFVSIPKGDSGARSLSYYNVGIRALAVAEGAVRTNNGSLAQTELDRSMRELETAFRYSPGSTEINLALGNLWLAKGDSARAGVFYQRVLSLEPRHPSALNNLGVVALKEEHWELASRLFSRALELEPSSAKLYFLLAKAKISAGDRNAALIAINSALAIKPDQKEFLAIRETLESLPESVTHRSPETP